MVYYKYSLGTKGELKMSRYTHVKFKTYVEIMLDVDHVDNEGDREEPGYSETLVRVNGGEEYLLEELPCYLQDAVLASIENHLEG